MADPVEAAIKNALLQPLIGFCSSPAIPLALPNIDFSQPTPARGALWLRATILPADSFAPSIGFDSTIQHFGLMQVDIFYSENSGEIAPARIAGSLAMLYRRGTDLFDSGFKVNIYRAPTVRRAIKDEPWLMLPVVVPYQCFAPTPA